MSAVSGPAALVRGIVAFDEVESAHRQETLRWLDSTSDIYRRVKPGPPEQHLVSYFVPVDRARGRVLLVEHRGAGLWLPPGGHAEPGEDPWATVQREAQEELGLVEEGAQKPVFLTVTRTNDAEPHTDVSLWYLLTRDSQEPLKWDRREFRSIR